MNFNSLTFLFIFLPLFLVVFYLTKKEYRYIVILLGSIIFYYYSGLFNTILIICISVLNYIFGLLINKFNSKILFIIFLLINIITLGLFKYNSNLILPLGMSFYTFNNLSYIIDIKRKKYKPEKNILYYLTYSLLFCHVTMGPITRFDSIRNDLKNLNPSFKDITNGFKRFLNGLIIKVLIADNLGLLFNSIIIIDNKTIILCLLCLIVFALELYLDFSGYTSMAIGLGKMIGINYSENFNYPYLATSVSDFWRRWHMSLTNFFKEYVYIPLGGNRVSTFRKITNVLIIWLLTGAWHGNSMNFIIWGLYYGIILLLEKYVFNNILKRKSNTTKHIYVLVIVLFGYIFFSINDFNNIGLFLKHLFSPNLIDSTVIFYLKENILLIIVSILLCLKMPDNIVVKLDNSKLYNTIELLLYLVLFIIVISYIVNGSYLPFLYNNF